MGKVEKAFITFDDLVLYTSLPVGTLRDYVARKTIPHYKVGRRLVFKLAEIDAWLAEHYRPTIAERIAAHPELVEVGK